MGRGQYPHPPAALMFCGDILLYLLSYRIRTKQVGCNSVIVYPSSGYFTRYWFFDSVKPV